MPYAVTALKCDLYKMTYKWTHFTNSPWNSCSWILVATASTTDHTAKESGNRHIELGNFCQAPDTFINNRRWFWSLSKNGGASIRGGGGLQKQNKSGFTDIYQTDYGRPLHMLCFGFHNYILNNDSSSFWYCCDSCHGCRKWKTFLVVYFSVLLLMLAQKHILVPCFLLFASQLSMNRVHVCIWALAQIRADSGQYKCCPTSIFYIGFDSEYVNFNNINRLDMSRHIVTHANTTVSTNTQWNQGPIQSSVQQIKHIGKYSPWEIIE